MKTKIFVVLFIIFPPFLFSSLEDVYTNAYAFARNPQGLSFTHGQAQSWAKKFIEQKTILRQNGLVDQYNEALNFAMSNNGLGLSFVEAERWAKFFILSNATPSSQKVSNDLNVLFREVPFLPEEAKEWGEKFFSNSQPLYFNAKMLQIYDDIYLFCRSHPFFSEDHDNARKLALTFIQSRFIFDSKKTLFEQHFLAFEFAENSNGLRLDFDEAKKWAQNYIQHKGFLDREISLRSQYAEAFAFARSREGLSFSDEKAKKWAQKFIEEHAHFSRYQNLLDSYREAYIFAYNGEVLPMVYELRKTPKYFLGDEALRYAKNLVQSRAQIQPDKNLLRQFEDAVIFAYASDGLKLDYYEARNWAKKFIENSKLY